MVDLIGPFRIRLFDLLVLQVTIPTWASLCAVSQAHCRESPELWHQSAQNAMDPLGAIASTITVVAATIKVSEGILAVISSIRYLPDELLATSNDVTDFRLVLVYIQDAIVQEESLVNALLQAQPGGQLAIDANLPAAAPQAKSMVQQAQNKLSEMEEVVRKTRAIQNAKGFAAFGRIRLLERTKMRLLREDLNNLKVNINAHFTVKSRCATPKLLERYNVHKLIRCKHMCFPFRGPCQSYLSRGGSDSARDPTAYRQAGLHTSAD